MKKTLSLLLILAMFLLPPGLTGALADVTVSEPTEETEETETDTAAQESPEEITLTEPETTAEPMVTDAPEETGCACAGNCRRGENCPMNSAKEAPGYDIVYTSSNPIPEICDRVRPAVVEVTCSQEKWDAVTRIAEVVKLGGASGCYILQTEEAGYILTNYHVVADGDIFTLEWLSGEIMDAELVGYDDGTDIAVLKFTDSAPEGVEVIPMGDSDSLRIGELAICIGNPGSGAEVLFGSVTAGIISGMGREDINAGNFSRSISTIQTDAAINTGNSGGALLNARGELIGIPTLKLMYNYTTVFEGLGFCVPINTVKEFIKQIIDTGKVVRPRIGITVTDNDGPEEAMKKYPPIGVLVYNVEPGGPSDKAGLKVNDVITEINGQRIRAFSELLKELDKYSAGDTVTLKVYRYKYENGAISGGYTVFDAEITLMMID